MTVWVCATCGNEFPDTDAPPAGTCPICADERQWVPESGQRWTTYAELAAAGTTLSVDQLEAGLFSVTANPTVGIGQRGLLVRTPGGNLLWEPPGFIDDAAVAAVKKLGGIAVVSASHPHLVGAAVSWSYAFDNVPVLRAAADQRWVMRPDPVIRLWSGVTEILPGLSLIPCGGHFAGSSVAHWQPGANGRGALLSGDTIAIAGDRRSVSAMRSYVNDIPLSERAIRAIVAAIAPYDYDRVYGGFAVLDSDARAVVARSFDRYLRWIRGEATDDEVDTG